MELKFRPLKPSEIECRVSTICENGLALLLYKDARTDMILLDEVVGPMNWQRDHKELKENIYGGIGIRDDLTKEFIWKWDCGKESFSDSEKGESSDSFKRAGFNWGIGRELYTAPFIWIKPLDEKEFYNKTPKGSTTNPQYQKPVYATNTKFKVSNINYDKDKNIIGLEIIDGKKNVRFKGGQL